MRRRGPRPSATITPTRLAALKYLRGLSTRYTGVTLNPSYANAVALWQTDLVWTALRPDGRRIYGITAKGEEHLAAIATGSAP